jgi:hypothetical protein
MFKGWRGMVENVCQLRPKPSGEDHDQSRLRRSWPYRSDGPGRLLFKPDRFYPYGDSKPARAACRRRQTIHRQKKPGLGLRNYSREDLEAVRRAGEKLEINVLGLATIAADVTPELARATIASVVVLGALHASPEVKAALADRIR